MCCAAGLVKVGDYSLDKRLSDIYQTFGSGKQDNAYPPSLGRGGKKADIYRFGVLMLSLIKGSIIQEEIPEVPVTLSADLRDFISKWVNIYLGITYSKAQQPLKGFEVFFYLISISITLIFY